LRTAPSTGEAAKLTYDATEITSYLFSSSDLYSFLVSLFSFYFPFCFLFFLFRVNVDAAVNILSSTSSSFGASANSSKIDEKMQRQLLAEEEQAMNKYKVRHIFSVVE
jgi:hypothetical protein